MSDLISRKELMERVLQEEYDNDIHKDGRAKAIHHGEYRHFYKVIDEMPTAFDLESVIKEIHKNYNITNWGKPYGITLDKVEEILKSATNAMNGKNGG